MSTAEELGYKVGDQFVYSNKGAAGIDWFVDGSTITLTGCVEDRIPAFDGPAKEDGIGGNECKKGDITDGYAKTTCITPVKAVPAQPVTSNISVRVDATENVTIFIVSRVLTAAERAEVFNVLNSQGA